MELSKLLLKILYLVIVYALCFAILQAQTPLSGSNLYVIALLISVLVMYFTFEYLYNFLVSSQIIFQSGSGSDSDSNNNNNNNRNKVSGRSRVEHDSETNVNNSKQHSMNHKHKYIEDRVFR